MNNIIYTALATATLTASPFMVSSGSSVMGSVDVNFIISQDIVTREKTADDRQYLNSIMIKNSFDDRLLERKISQLPDSVKHALDKISEKCGYFDIKEVYADYSPVSNAIRIDMIIANDYLLIVRKTVEEDEDNDIAVSLSKGNETYLVDYFDLENLTKEVNDCIRG